jgi:hypothetical protein
MTDNINLIEQQISILNNLQVKLGEAAGAATSLEWRLRIIAELEPKVRDKLKEKTSAPFYKATLEHLIDAILHVFEKKLTSYEYEKIKEYRDPRNKLAHGSPVELMIALGTEPTGRKIDPSTKKPNILSEDELVEGSKSIERNQVLDTFIRQLNELISIVNEKILRNCKLKPY